jgi:xanthine dehydrogenase YagR molybdenum-binding subunit
VADYTWPERGKTSVICADADRVDGMPKATGAAKYAYDIAPDKMLLAKALGCPHAHCTIKSIDVSPALEVAGVVSAHALKEPGNEVRWQGDLLAVVAAETEGAAAEGLAAIAVEYEQMDVFVLEADLEGAEAAGRTGDGGEEVQLEEDPADELEQGEDEEDEAFEKRVAEAQEEAIQKLFDEADQVVEGKYGIHTIAHMCLEPHGSTCEWQDDKLTVHLSTQNVSGTAAQFAGPLEITADKVEVHCDYVGGGFGSKFQADLWGVAAARIAKETGRPVKLMLARDLELKNGGTRPSGFIQVKLGATKEGVVTVWDSHHWGTNGVDGSGIGQGVIPYVFNPPNRRRRQTTISINCAPGRAWRAPNHPQGCAITQVAYDDVAAALGLDSYDVFLANLPHLVNDAVPRQDVYRAEMEVAAEAMDWKAKWHAHGKGDADGDVVSGLGMAIHTWGGGPHGSTCTVKIHPDGGVETFLGSQDIGTGTKTVIGQVVAETLGLKLKDVKVNIGWSRYPASGPSGGSTTIGGVCESNRRASVDALEQLKLLVAKKLKVDAATLVASNGRIHVADDEDKGVKWKEACGLLGMQPLEAQGVFAPGQTMTNLTSSRVGGVQMAEVAVDRATGVVRMKKFVAVQDMGLIINPKTAISQIHGSVVMGIAYSLFEERIVDGPSGAFLNAEVADYKLARLGDVGEVVVKLYEPDSERSRGVVGLGEPPVISPGAAISNAVANALGVRVPVLPLTPDRVLAALDAAGRPA